MASIFEEVMDNIETLVTAIVAGEGVTVGFTSDGYNYDWPDAINKYDQANTPDGPFVNVYLEKEGATDNQGNQGGEYIFSLDLRFEVGYKFGEEQDNPVFSGQVAAMKAYDDLKRCFGRNPSIAANGNNGVTSIIIYESAVPDFSSNSKTIPLILKTFWRFNYRVDRGHPDIRTI